MLKSAFATTGQAKLRLSRGLSRCLAVRLDPFTYGAIMRETQGPNMTASLAHWHFSASIVARHDRTRQGRAVLEASAQAELRPPTCAAARFGSSPPDLRALGVLCAMLSPLRARVPSSRCKSSFRRAAQRVLSGKSPRHGPSSPSPPSGEFLVRLSNGIGGTAAVSPEIGAPGRGVRSTVLHRPFP
jgi:hypothetical protein